jgi:hypothetical protein
MKLTRVWTALTLAAAFLVGIAGRSEAQGVTTGAIAGIVTDAAGAPIENATVKLVNTLTGFTRSATTTAAGRYRFSSLEVGGGYEVTVTAIGFAPQTAKGIRANISQTTAVDFQLQRATVQLQELVTSAPLTAGEINPNRTGPQTVISDSLVARVPTLGRQLQDFVRLSPNVVTNPANRGVISAAGQNNRFNNIQVDGTSQTDRFGLGASGELGGQADGRGISLEAVKEYQVVISPFNVTQGNFTGALVNAVTKNGTNDYTGTAFFTYRDQSLGSNVPAIRATPFNVKQFGGSVGGPIVKDKLFFFLAGELQESSRPAGGPFLGGTSQIAPPVTQAQVDRFTQILQGYGLAEPGVATAVSNQNPITNLVGRFDWQLSDKTRLVVRNIFNDSKGDDFSRGTTFPLTSNRFRRSEWSNSSTVQAITNFANGGSNEFQLGWTRQRFKRSLPVRFPQVSVTVPSAVSAGAFATLRAGSEQNSQGNELDQDLVELRNDYTFPISQSTQSHLITIGTRNEFYQVRNAFLQNSFGSYTFASLDSLAAGLPNGYQVGLSRGADPQARFKGATFAAYIQDQWSPSSNFNLTVGFRTELPVFFDKPVTTPVVFSNFGRNTAAIPSFNPQLQPRLGFNWDVSGDQTTQIRGGVGIFGGNPAYVWLSNLFQNSGQGLAQLTCNSATGPNSPPAFSPNPDAPPAACGGGASLSTNVGTVNTADPGLRLPQVMRATLGIDRVLPGRIVGTLEGTYTNAISDLYYSNINLRGPQGVGQGGRVLYGTLSQGVTAGVPTVAVVNPGYGAIGGGVLDLRNTGANYAYSISGTLRKRFASSWEATAGYTYLQSKTVADLTSSVALSNWRFGRVYSGLENSTEVGTSAFEIPHRFVASVSYTAPWKNFPTDITLFYQGQSGTPYAYIYTGAGNRGDLNADGFNGNDPVYIPTDATNTSEILFEQFTQGTTVVTAAEQAAAFNAFIQGTPCLNNQRGTIMRRNSCRNGFFHQLDLSVRQSLPAIKGQRLSLQAEVYNFLNLIDSDWGKAKYANSNALAPGTNPQVNLLEHRGQVGDVPVVRFNPGLTADNRLQNLQGAAAFWQAQFTLRYAF